MKNKSSKLFTIGILFLGIVISFNGCQNEEIHSNNEQRHKGANPNQVTLEFFKSTTKIQDVNTFTKKGLNSTNKNHLERNNNNESLTFSDFYINTDHIMQYVLNDEGDLSFSFKLYLLEDEQIEGEHYNLVINQNENAEWKSSIYHLIEDNDDSNETLFSSVEQVFHSNGLPNGVMERSSWTLYCGNTYSQFNCQGCPPGDCDLCNLCVTTSVTCQYVYTGTGDDVPHFDDATDSDIGFNFNGGGGGSSSSSNTEYLEELKENCINDIVSELGLSSTLKICLSDNTTFAEACGLNNVISNYLADNQVSSNPNGGIGFSVNSPEAEEVVRLLVKENCDEDSINEDDKVFKSPSFVGSETECIHNTLIQDPNNNFYAQMMATFTNSLDILFFNIDDLPNNEWGYTFGHEFNTITNPLGLTTSLDFYNIKIDTDIESSSNVVRMVTLCHELIHAFMYDTLDDLGVITYYPNGDPKFDAMQCNVEANVNLNTLSEKDRWVALICAYNNNPNIGSFTHALFNTANFGVNNYTTQLQNLLLNSHDWDSEPLFLKTSLEDELGTQWKQKASEYLSWKGLEGTAEFVIWAQNNNIDPTLDADGQVMDQSYTLIISSLKASGKRDCL